MVLNRVRAWVPAEAEAYRFHIAPRLQPRDPRPGRATANGVPPKGTARISHGPRTDPVHRSGTTRAPPWRRTSTTLRLSYPIGQLLKYCPVTVRCVDALPIRSNAY